MILLSSLAGVGQSSTEPFILKITTGKTTTLLFAYAIKQVDRGASVVMVQKSAGMENVLMVKAAAANFPETNLTVITADGKLFPFAVQYDGNPGELNYSFTDSGRKPVVLFASQLNAAMLDSDAIAISEQKYFLHKRVNGSKMQFKLQGIYLKDNLLWFCLSLKNNSVIDFYPDGIRFFVRNKKTPKRTALQEINHVPVYESKLSILHGEEMRQCVLGFKTFTIADSQQLVIQCRDRDGGRAMTLAIPSRTILKARKIQ